MTIARGRRVAIPAAAWRHRIGEPIAAGRPRVDMPMIDDGPTGGVPIGGIGSGSIGRTCDGVFARWHLRVGTHRFAPMHALGFSALVEAEVRPLQGAAATGTYHALFPRAWIEHDWPEHGLRIVERQLSPVLPHNYRESSYPIGLFAFAIENTAEAARTVTIRFAWNALDEDGVPCAASTRVVRKDGLAGAVLDNGRDDTGRSRGQFALLAAEEHGTADVRIDGSAATASLTCEVPPGDSRTVRFALAWDFPLMRFGSGRAWYRRYTRFFGREGTNAERIAREALAREDEWERAIERWQSPILEDARRPPEYAMALFNELYLVVDGGTAWEDGMEGDPSPREGDGRFAILECFDYPFYNTHDVLFYASWAFAANWPELEARMMQSLAETVTAADPRMVTIETTGLLAPRKDAGAVAHDVGAPDEDPWMMTNRYRFQDANTWKDLNSKFVLQLWRDVTLLGRRDLLATGWGSVVSSLERLAETDRDGDGLPEHTGADQTFDTWTMSGPSAYAGGLYVAALSAAERMAAIVGDDALRARYSERRERAARALHERLWNGRYLRYDGDATPSSDSVMADQLCGLWWCDATGLPAYLSPEEVRSALKTIVERNVLGFAGGRLGAVNGARPHGGVDTSSEQSQEAWPGVTYLLAAHLLARGLEDEAWTTAAGAIRTTYQRGFQFRTPEAWDEDANYRASIYLRPLAIWAIEHALSLPPPHGLK